MSGKEKVIRSFKFLQKRADSEEWFGEQELIDATGWKKASVKAYISKQLKGYLEISGQGAEKKYRVKKQFLRVTEEEFIRVTTQNRLVVQTYQRAKHEVVLQFEFLLPLSREEHLKRALDELFYTDTLTARMYEIGLDKLATIIERKDTDTDDSFVAKVLAIVGDYFGGYSIFHVQGRFRAADLTDIQGAADAMVKRERYLIDETTAVVRFIAPCNTSKEIFGDDFDSISKALTERPAKDETADIDEITMIRRLFFFFFVETVVSTVKGEDEIWLLETGTTRKLYRWTKQN